MGVTVIHTEQGPVVMSRMWAIRKDLVPVTHHGQAGWERVAELGPRDQVQAMGAPSNRGEITRPSDLEPTVGMP